VLCIRRVPRLGGIIVVRLRPGMQTARRAQYRNEKQTNSHYTSDPRHGLILSASVLSVRHSEVREAWPGLLERLGSPGAMSFLASHSKGELLQQAALTQSI
jgi:hypothetical protein